MDYLNGILLGLSTGIFCLTYCAPVYLPQLLAQNDRRFGWTVFAKFNLGRLLAYAAFGGLFGWLGAALHQSFLHTFANWIMAILALLLILYGLGLSLPHLSWCAWTKRIKLPLVSGILVGVNICPPFLLALTYNFQTGGITHGVLFFLAFFAGTTLYFVPLTLLGFLSGSCWVRQGARLAAIAVGLIMLTRSLWIII